MMKTIILYSAVNVILMKRSVLDWLSLKNENMLEKDFLIFISVFSLIPITRIEKDFLNHLFLKLFKYLRELRDLQQLILLGKVVGELRMVGDRKNNLIIYWMCIKSLCTLQGILKIRSISYDVIRKCVDLVKESRFGLYVYYIKFSRGYIL